MGHDGGTSEIPSFEGDAPNVKAVTTLLSLGTMAPIATSHENGLDLRGEVGSFRPHADDRHEKCAEQEYTL